MWQTFLYQPLVNILIVLYHTIGFGNLGLAVVWLTVLIRMMLLPLSIAVGRNRAIFIILTDQINRIKRDFRQDLIGERQAVRRLLDQNHVNPWLAFILAMVHILVLVLLYQLFRGGIQINEEILYQGVLYPYDIDSTFIGLFDISKSNWLLALVIGLAIHWFLRKETADRQNNYHKLIYVYLLPFAIFFFLSQLPSVKSLFILTSMLISYVIHVIETPIYHKILDRTISRIREARRSTAEAPEIYENPLVVLRKKVKQKPI